MTKIVKSCLGVVALIVAILFSRTAVVYLNTIGTDRIDEALNQWAAFVCGVLCFLCIPIAIGFAASVLSDIDSGK